MHDFAFRNNELYCEDVKVAAIARKVGTPFYLYSHKTLIDHYRKIRDAFAPVKPLICFSMKSNGSLAVIKSLIREGSGIDIVSGGELRKALKAGADPKKIVFASVGKTEEELRLAISKGILLFNIESEAELQTINGIAQSMKKIVRAALRINPDVDALTHDKITTGTLKKKFGIDPASAHRILKMQKNYSHVQIIGLHFHIGSQIVSLDPFVNAIKKIGSFMEALRKDGILLKYLNIGGGMGIIYKKEKAQTAKNLAKAILPHLKATGLKVIMEPGRFITGNAGIFVTKILYYKDNGLRKFYIVDGGMNDLIRPSLYEAYHEIVSVKKKKGGTLLVDVVGPICESSDFFGKDRRLPQLQQNDLLAVMSTGAYGYTMASNYNIRPRPAEILVRGNRFFVIRKRESFKDLIKNESIPSFLK